jgi:hypothetical protein
VESRVNQGKQLAAPLESAQDLAYLAVRGSIALMGALGLDKTASAFRYHAMDMDQIPADRRGLVDERTAPVTPLEGGW